MTPSMLGQVRDQHRTDHADDAPMRPDGIHEQAHGVYGEPTDCTYWGCTCYCGERRDQCHVPALLDALAAERALSDALADLLDVAAREAHATGPVIDHWGTPVGDGPVPFEQCDDEWCEAARGKMAEHGKSREADRG